MTRAALLAVAGALVIAGCATTTEPVQAPPRTVVIAPPASMLRCKTEEPRLTLEEMAAATDHDGWEFATRYRTWGRGCRDNLDNAKEFIRSEAQRQAPAPPNRHSRTRVASNQS